MEEKILALLEAKFPDTRKDGLRQLAGALALQAVTDEEAAALAGKLTDGGVNAFITNWRKSTDSEIAKATRTQEDSLRKKYDLVEKKTDKPDAGTDAKTDAGEWTAEAINKLVMDAINKVIEPTLAKVNSIESKTVNAARRETLVRELADMPEGFRGKILKDFDRMAFPDEDGFSAYLAETKTDAAAFKQELANRGLAGEGKPVFGNLTPEGVSEAVQGYIKGNAEGGKTLGGKEV